MHGQAGSQDFILPTMNLELHKLAADPPLVLSRLPQGQKIILAIYTPAGICLMRYLQFHQAAAHGSEMPKGKRRITLLICQSLTLIIIQ